MILSSSITIKQCKCRALYSHTYRFMTSWFPWHKFMRAVTYYYCVFPADIYLFKVNNRNARKK